MKVSKQESIKVLFDMAMSILLHGGTWYLLGEGNSSYYLTKCLIINTVRPGGSPKRFKRV